MNKIWEHTHFLFQEIDADKTADQLSDEIFEHAMDVITAVQIKKVDKLWTDDPLWWLSDDLLQWSLVTAE